MMIPTMVEEEVEFSASSKNKLNSHPDGINEEVHMYEEMTRRHEPSQPVPDTTASAVPSPGTEGACRCNYQLLAVYLGALCVFLLLVLVVELTIMCCTIAYNPYFWRKYYIPNEDLRKNHNNLTETLESETRITNLTGENQQLETQNKNLSDQITNMETTYGPGDVQGQFSIKVLCPKRNDDEIMCQFISCGWLSNPSTCYSYNAEEQRTWEEARDDCRRKGSDLAVIGDQREKNDVTRVSVTVAGIAGYWIGLRAVEGKWKWIDGTELTNQTWIQPPVNDDQCVISGKNQEWRSVRCEDKHAWICEERPFIE
nr:C-type lectin domain family 17, member A [Nothobranchius furzeri]